MFVVAATGGWSVNESAVCRLTIRPGLARTVLVFLVLSGVAKMSGVWEFYDWRGFFLILDLYARHHVFKHSLSKFQWINLRTEIAWSDLEESALVVNEIIKDSINIDDLFDERTLLNRPPLWSSGQSSWLQIQGSRVRFPSTTKKIVGLERGPLSLVSTTEELLDRKVAAPV
jgi:hypothetical protein